MEPSETLISVGSIPRLIHRACYFPKIEKKSKGGILRAHYSFITGWDLLFFYYVINFLSVFAFEVIILSYFHVIVCVTKDNKWDCAVDS